MPNALNLRNTLRWRGRLGAMLLVLAVTACGGGGGGSSEFPVGGTVSGYTGNGLVLQLNGGDGITLVPGAATFAFATRLASGTVYAVTIAMQPNGQDCTLANGSGTIQQANVANVAVTCGAMAPLTVTDIAPADGAQGVSRDVQPRVTFSDAVDPASVNNNASLRLLPGFTAGVATFDPLSAPRSYEFAGPTVTMMPRTKLLPLMSYLTLFGADLRGVRGQQPTQSTSRRFTTADGAWRTPAVTLEFANFPAAMAVNAAGNAVAVGRTQSGSVVSYHFNAGTGTWRGPRPLTLDVTARQLSLAMDDEGHAVVLATIPTNLPNNTIVVAQNYDTVLGTWKAPTIRSGVGENVNASDPQIVMLRDGTARAVWTTGDLIRDGAQRHVVVATWSGGPAGSWTPGDFVYSARVGVGIEDLAITSGGTSSDPVAMISWSQNGTSIGSKDIWALRALRGGLDGSATMVSHNDGSFEHLPTVAVDVRGRSYVAWTQITGPFSGVWLRRHVNGAWGPFELVANVLNGNGDSPSIAADQSGELGAESVWVVWTQADHVWASNIERNGPLSARVQLSQTSAGPAPLPRIVVDRAGNALVAWRQDNMSSAPIVSARYEATNRRWSAETAPLNESAGRTPPELSISANGDVHMAWFETVEGTSIQYKVRRFD